LQAFFAKDRFGGTAAQPLSMLSENFQVGPSDAGRRLDQYLAAQIPDFSRSRLQDLIRAGHITLNGVVAKPNAKVREGDRIEVREPEATPTELVPEEIPLSILYEDADLLVLDKPAGLVVHPAEGNWSGTVVHALLAHCGALSTIGGEQRPGIVHRLDKETSGCLVVAKNDFSHQALAQQFAGRSVEKVYLALAAGRFAARSGSVKEPIGRHPVDRKRMAVMREEGKGRAAHTDWRVVQEVSVPAAPGGIGTVVECTLHTGRTHQIRVHLQHLGHGLLGDAVYGRRTGFERQMLHAWRLGFDHPRTGVRVRCRAPLPDDFQAAGIMEPVPEKR
jgi:23S rRNA pseudouridine1911/1915/1917 synthase